ncbi:MAG TPA: CbtA family protein [Acetobacteraceae bacterium]|nr:CbtA family protein [Acetobacteraceae bacterium]
MVRTLLVRGMLAGILAGLIASVFAWLFGEPRIDQAIAFEDHLRQLAGAAPEPELVSRAVQSTIGLLTAAVVYGSALGGIFALVFAYAHGRIGRLSPRATAAILAAAGFVTLILVPQLKYPANPPAVGDAETIGARTALYFIMIAFSIAAAVASLSTGRSLAARLGGWNAALVGVACYGVAMAIVMLVLRPVDEVPTGFSADLLWQFRLASLAVEAVLWTTLGLTFGILAERPLASRAQRMVFPRAG